MNKLKEQNKRGCVSFGYGEDGRKYYSVNGSTDKIRHKHIIEDIIGDKPVFCGIKHAFTILEPVVPHSIFLMVDPFYESLKYENKTLGFCLADKRIYFNSSRALDYDNRYFTCAEKKLIDYADKHKIHLVLMYSSKEPCYHCLPTIDSIYFLRNNEIKMIKKEFFSLNWDDETVFNFEIK